jgi:hypothetical protein
VRKFQSTHALEVDGVATPELQEFLFSDQAPKRSSGGGSSATPTPAPDAVTPTPAPGDSKA